MIFTTSIVITSFVMPKKLSSVANSNVKEFIKINNYGKTKGNFRKPGSSEELSVPWTCSGRLHSSRHLCNNKNSFKQKKSRIRYKKNGVYTRRKSIYGRSNSFT